MPKTYMTKAGIDKLTKDLEYLRGTKRREIAAALANARTQGDLSENSEYDAAREALGYNESRITELEHQLADAEEMPDDLAFSDKAYLGATVRVLDLDHQEEETFHIVCTNEADPAKGRISTESPVGKALLGRQVGDEVEVVAPRSILRFRLLEISRT